jgi:hypothetical protein
MKEFDQKKFKKKLKKKLEKQTAKYGNIKVQTKGTGGFYFLGFVGSAIYFVSTATNFWDGVWGIIKSLVWPAFLVYEAFTKLLG